MNNIYDHLKSYGFGQQRGIVHRLAKTSSKRISKFLESYEELVQKHPLTIRAAIGATDIYPDSEAEPFPLALIQQLAIYANRVYVHDPLLKMVYRWKYLDLIPPLLVRYPSREERVAFFREELGYVIGRLLALRPLITAGIIHLTPSELIQSQKLPGMMYADDLYGPANTLEDTLGLRRSIQDLPPEIAKYCQQALTVLPAKYVNREATILPEPLAPRNMIAVHLPDGTAKFYQLLDVIPDPNNKQDERRVKMFFDIESKTPVDQSTFENWVEGSKYEMVTEILSRLHNDLNLASFAGAKFITNIQSSRDLASLSIEPRPYGASEKVISALLQCELPFFDKANFASIAKARLNEAAFAEFITAMNKTFGEIDALPNSEDFQSRVNEIYRDLLITPLANIKRQANILRRNLFLDATVLLGSLAATIFTQGNTLVTAAAIYAAAKAIEMYKQDKAEEDKIKQLPSFFYWNVVRKK